MTRVSDILDGHPTFSRLIEDAPLSLAPSSAILAREWPGRVLCDPANGLTCGLTMQVCVRERGGVRYGVRLQEGSYIASGFLVSGQTNPASPFVVWWQTRDGLFGKSRVEWSLRKPAPGRAQI